MSELFLVTSSAYMRSSPILSTIPPILLRAPSWTCRNDMLFCTFCMTAEVRLSLADIL